MRLKDSDEAFLEAAAEVLSSIVPPVRVKDLAANIVERARDEAVQRSVSHRALPDAKQQWRIWLAVRRLAHEEGGSQTPRP